MAIKLVQTGMPAGAGQSGKGRHGDVIAKNQRSRTGAAATAIQDDIILVCTIHESS